MAAPTIACYCCLATIVRHNKRTSTHITVNILSSNKSLIAFFVVFAVPGKFIESDDPGQLQTVPCSQSGDAAVRVFHRIRKRVVIVHESIIDDKFWAKHSNILN